MGELHDAKGAECLTEFHLHDMSFTQKRLRQMESYIIVTYIYPLTVLYLQHFIQGNKQTYHTLLRVELTTYLFALSLFIQLWRSGENAPLV